MNRMNPRSWLLSAARHIQDRIEERFARTKKLIPCGSSGLIRMQPQIYRGQTVILGDGSQVCSGMPVLELHLDSRRVAAVYAGGIATMNGRIQLLKEAREGFAWLAQWLESSVDGREIKAIRSITLLERELAHFGFEFRKLPAFPWVLVGAYMRWLGFIYSARNQVGQRARKQKGRTPPGEMLRLLIPMEAWISRNMFLARHGTGHVTGP